MKKLIAIFISVISLSSSAFFVSAAGYTYIPYNSYSYNEWGESVTSADGYYPNKYIVSDVDGKIKFDNPIDMYIDGDGNFYILNAGSKNIVILDSELKLTGNIKSFKTKDGSEISLSEPNGIFYKNDLLYIADSGLQSVLVSDLSGNIVRTVEKPESEMYPLETFHPKKVLLDYLDNICVIVDGVYQGALCFDKKGEFTEYYGSNTVTATYSVIMQRFWRKFMTEDQIDNTATIIPVEYANFDIDGEGFVYTCTSKGSSGEIKKLNSLGTNILPDKQYGDSEVGFYKDTYYSTAFCDIAVDEEGFIFALDSTMKRIFVYDSYGEQSFIFGSEGNQLGRFKSVTAIDTYGSNVYVLDNKKNAVTEFSLTEYGKTVHSAAYAYSQGRYTESEELWNNVLKQNKNYSPAYVGIGKAKYYQGDYTAAMKYFELGGDRSQQSTAFKELRQLTVRKYLSAVLVFAVIVVTVTIILKKRLKGKKKRENKAN